jgi:hypothetical protein
MSAGPLRRVLYVSEASLAPDAVEPLVRHAQSANAARGITGVLVYTGGAFAQYLEGPPDAVRQLVETLAADPRHCRMRLLLEEAADARSAPSWRMALVEQPSADDLLQLLLEGEAPARDRAAHLAGLLVAAAGQASSSRPRNT